MMTAFWCLQVNGGHSPGGLPPRRQHLTGGSLLTSRSATRPASVCYPTGGEALHSRVSALSAPRGVSTKDPTSSSGVKPDVGGFMCALPERSYWIPGSWYVRMVYTDAIPCHDA